MPRPDLLLVAAVKRSQRMSLRAHIPALFSVLGDPRAWPRFGDMTAAKRETLATAYDRWQASRTSPPSPSDP